MKRKESKALKQVKKDFEGLTLYEKVKFLEGLWDRVFEVDYISKFDKQILKDERNRFIRRIKETMKDEKMMAEVLGKDPNFDGKIIKQHGWE